MFSAMLIGNARQLALNSNEPAEIVTRAAFASCLAHRAAILDSEPMRKAN